MESDGDSNSNSNSKSITDGNKDANTNVSANPNSITNSKQFELDINSILLEISSENSMTSSAQLKRLINTNFISPYEVLIIQPEATEEEIKRQYRQLSILVHPDKCSDPKAADAFHILETAYKTLQDPEKKKFFQRVIREAKERVELERAKENKTRARKGQPPLPKETFEVSLKQMTKKIIDEIEERKTLSDKMEHAHKKRERDEEEDRRTQEESEKQYNKEWESFRDKRVKNWVRFQGKILNGKRKGRYETRPPRYKTEERGDNDKIDVYRPNTII